MDRQERRLNTFHLRRIRRILGISWQDKVTNADVLSHAGLPSMYTMLSNADCDGWVSNVWRKVSFQKTSSTLSWHWGGEPPAALTCDIKAVDIDTMSWEGIAADRTGWRSVMKQHLKTKMTAGADKRARRKEGSGSIRPETTRVICDKDCHSRIGLFSHKRRCYNPARNEYN